jgi:hypothetical protein
VHVYTPHSLLHKTPCVGCWVLLINNNAQCDMRFAMSDVARDSRVFLFLGLRAFRASRKVQSRIYRHWSSWYCSERPAPLVAAFWLTQYSPRCRCRLLVSPAPHTTSNAYVAFSHLRIQGSPVTRCDYWVPNHWVTTANRKFCGRNWCSCCICPCCNRHGVRGGVNITQVRRCQSRPL